MFITYCGIGAFTSRGQTVKIDDWLAKLLTIPPKIKYLNSKQPVFETMGVKDAIKIIKNQATSQLSNFIVGGHWFSIAGVSLKKRFIGYITNMNPGAKSSDRPNKDFKTHLKELPDNENMFIVVPNSNVDSKDVNTLYNRLNSASINMLDFDQLLASIHFNSATVGPNKNLVSVTCTTTFTDPTSPTMGFRGTYHGVPKSAKDRIAVEPKVLFWYPTTLWGDIWEKRKK